MRHVYSAADCFKSEYEHTPSGLLKIVGSLVLFLLCIIFLPVKVTQDCLEPQSLTMYAHLCSYGFNIMGVVGVAVFLIFLPLYAVGYLSFGA